MAQTTIKPYVIEKKIEVSKAEYEKHLEEQVKYWQDRLKRHEEEAVLKIERYVKKQEMRATELSVIIMNKEAELKELRKAKEAK